MAGPPNELVLVVRPDLPIRTAADLKGRSVGVTGPSLTGWLVSALSRQQGFGPNGIKMNYAQPASSWALMKTAGTTTDSSVPTTVEELSQALARE